LPSAADRPRGGTSKEEESLHLQAGSDPSLFWTPLQADGKAQEGSK
jgi:hypothetical protein